MRNYVRVMLGLFLMYATTGSPVNAQTLPVTSGLVLNVDASVGFDANTGVWTDQSTVGNNLVSVVGTPALVIVNGRSAIRFNGNLMNSVTTSTITDAAGSIFLVSASSNPTATMSPISIAEDVTVYEELVIESSVVYHHSAPSSWVGRPHQCIASVPANNLFLTAGIFRTGPKDFDAYINGVKSTASTDTEGTAQNYIATPRRIYIGGRRYNTNTYIYHPFVGDVYAVLVYNRALNALEVSQVNNYLKCKYNINYEGCNAGVNCNLAVNELDRDEELSFQCTPNPAKGGVAIKYTLSKNPANASNVITDLTGKQLQKYTLLDSKTGSVNISTINLADGIYFYSFINNGVIIGTKKMVVLK